MGKRPGGRGAVGTQGEREAPVKETSTHFISKKLFLDVGFFEAASNVTGVT